MSVIRYFEPGQVNLYNYENSFIAKLKTGIVRKKELLQELKLKLELPDYFGNNWDALEECIRDFNWIKKDQIIIIHDDFPILDEKDIGIYIQILNDAIKDWKDSSEHRLDVFFPFNSKVKIEQILSSK